MKKLMLLRVSIIKCLFIGTTYMSNDEVGCYSVTALATWQMRVKQYSGFDPMFQKQKKRCKYDRKDLSWPKFTKS